MNPLNGRQKLDLDSRSFLMMLKGALAPTITIAMYVCRVAFISTIETKNDPKLPK